MLARLLPAGPLMVLALACASPTLPLPPPLAPSIERVDADHVKLTAACNVAERGAVIVVVNEGPTGLGPGVPRDQAVGGAIADPVCGSWDSTVFAQTHDILVITYQIADQISQPTDVEAP